jgi:ankyrin repeat protein
VACQNGSSEMVSYYLDEFKVNINEKDFNGVTCLHFACINGNEKIVALLLNHGAKILADKNGKFSRFLYFINF